MEYWQKMVQWHRNGRLEDENNQSVETPVLTAAGFHSQPSHAGFLLLDFSFGYLKLVKRLPTSI
ncbi:hypothetical protein VCRA2119O147_340046 [Vibrio crassostreae]|nr:hypothetical protein VCRA2119O147_340046 [Vibrio crassostreae]